MMNSKNKAHLYGDAHKQKRKALREKIEQNRVRSLLFNTLAMYSHVEGLGVDLCGHHEYHGRPMAWMVMESYNSDWSIFWQ